MNFQVVKNRSGPDAMAVLKGILCLFFSAAVFSIYGWIVKANKELVTTWDVGFFRWLLGAVVIYSLFKSGRLSNLWGKHKFLIAARGLVSTITFLCITAATQMIPLSQSTVLFFSCTMFAALNGIWLNSRKVYPLEWLLVLGGFAGVVLVLNPNGASFELGLGHFLALGAAFGMGLSLAMVRRLSADNSPFTLYFYFCLAGVPVSAWPAVQNIDMSWLHNGALPVLLATAVFSSMGQLSVNHGMRFVPAHTGAVLLSSQVVFSAIIGVAFFDEELTWSLISGAVLILTCGGFLSRKSKKAPRSALESSPTVGNSDST